MHPSPPPPGGARPSIGALVAAAMGGGAAPQLSPFPWAPTVTLPGHVGYAAPASSECVGVPLKTMRPSAPPPGGARPSIGALVAAAMGVGTAPQLSPFPWTLPGHVGHAAPAAAAAPAAPPPAAAPLSIGAAVAAVLRPAPPRTEGPPVAARARDSSAAAALIKNSFLPARGQRAARINGVLAQEPAYRGAVLSLLDTRGHLQETRSAKAALEASGAAQVYQGLGPLEAGGALLLAQRVSALTDHRCSAMNVYERHLVDNGVSPYPVTAQKIAGYLAYRILVQNCKSGALRSWFSSLRVGMQATEKWPWPTVADEGAVGKLVNFLCVIAPSVTEHSRCFSVRELQAVRRWCLDAGTVRGRVSWALIAVLVGMQARETEIADGHMKRGDLTQTRDGLVLGAHLPKTRQDTFNPQLRVLLGMPAGLEWLCAKAALDAIEGDHFSPPDAADPLFGTMITRDGRLGISKTPLSAASITTLVTQAFKACCGDMTGFNAHFGRTTGYSLLITVAGLDIWWARAIGGWAPQDVLGKHYAQLTSPQMAEGAAIDLRNSNRSPLCCDGGKHCAAVARSLFWHHSARGLLD